jgi:hypothetical protein
MNEVTRILSEAAQGDPQAADRLLNSTFRPTCGSAPVRIDRPLW